MKGLGHSSVLFIIECQVDFVLRIIEEMMGRGSRSVSVLPSTEDKFMFDLGRQMKKLVWGNEDCGSWYADARGVVTALWPWNSTKYWRGTRRPDFSKFEFTQ